MARQRSPDREKAEQLYLKSNGELKLKEIAKKLYRPTGTVRGWKNKDKWDDKLNGTFQKESKKKRNAPNKKKDNKPKHIKVAEEAKIENSKLTERQRLFCLYYIKSFNQTMAAIKAGYEPSRAHVTGSELVRNSKVASEIRRLKGAMTNELFIDAMDVLRKYIAIAFADITDYVKFGKREVPVMGAFGPIKDEDGQQIMKEINFVDFKESYMVDGSIIKEAKQGKDGVSIKLEDKKWALEKLEKYFDLLPDKFKRKIEEEKLALAKIKAGVSDEEDNADDGFIEALKETVKDVWEDEE